MALGIGSQLLTSFYFNPAETGGFGLPRIHNFYQAGPRATCRVAVWTDFEFGSGGTGGVYLGVLLRKQRRFLGSQTNSFSR